MIFMISGFLFLITLGSGRGGYFGGGYGGGGFSSGSSGDPLEVEVLLAEEALQEVFNKAKE